ncbi:hypothetical protein ADL05_26020 [Nocardiopsis sp. NRRL B-16309]|nr:hypothetical protein ADL05_26020 [Nocardiopsis sp. NRRL B-16309]
MTSPVGDYNGDVGGVKFYKGRAVVDSDTHGAAVAYMRRRGYTLTPINETAASEERVPEQDGPVKPKAADNKDTWVAYTVATTDLSEAEAGDLTKTELQELADKEQES